MATNITISTGDTTTVVTVPEVQNNITVSKNEITSAEREKISNMVTLDGAQTISGAKTFTANTNLNGSLTVITGTVLSTGSVTVSNQDLTVSGSGGLSVGGASTFGGTATYNADLIANNLKFIGNGTSILAPVDFGGLIPDDLEIRSNGNVVVKLDYDNDESGQKFKVTDNSGNVKFSVDEGGSVAFSEYSFPDAIGSATQVLKVNSSEDGLEFGDASVVASLNDLTDVNANFNASDLVGVNFQGQQINWSMSRALVWDPVDNRVKLKEDTPEYYVVSGTQGSPGPGQQFVSESIASLGGGASDGLHTNANGVLSINQGGQIPSTLNLYVNGDARVNGAIQVGDTSGVTYAFPTTDGTANQVLATDGSGAVTFVTPSTSNVTEGTNLYYTDARVAANSAVAANTAKVSYPTADSTKVAFISVTQAVDLDTMESDIATNNAKVGYTDSAVDSRIAAASIDDLSDVDTSTVAPTDGQALVWDNANSKWEPGSVSGGSSSLSGLTDTSITSPGAGEALVYNNDTSVWENAEALVELKTSVDAWIYNGNQYYMGAAGSLETNPLGIYFKPDGTRMFISGRADDRIKEFSLSTAWDITTASYVKESANLSGGFDGSVSGLFFKSDGTKVYLCGYGNDVIGEWTLSTAWDISTMGSRQTYDTTSDGYTTPYGLDLKPDGTEVYLATWDAKKVAQYTMSTAFDISTLSFTREFDVSNEASQNVNSVRFAGNGTRMIIMDDAEKFFEYSLSTAWDISTATFLAESVALSPNSNNDDFFYYEGGGQVFVISDGADSVYEYAAKNYSSSRGLSVVGVSAGSGTLSGGSIVGSSLSAGSGTVTAGNGTFSGNITASGHIDNSGRFRGAKNNSQAELAVWGNTLGTSNKYIKLGGNVSATNDQREQGAYRHPATPGNHIIELGARGSSITHIYNLTELQEVTVNDNIIVSGNPKVEDTNPTATGTTIYNDTFTEASDTALGSHTSDSGHTYSTIFDDTGGNGPNLTVFGGASQAGMDQSVDNEGQTFVSSAVTSGVDYELIWNYQVDLTGINGNDAINFPFGVVDSNNYFLLSLTWNSTGAPHGNSMLIKVANGAAAEHIADPISYHSLAIASNTAYDVKIKLVDRQHYIYHDNTLVWSGYLDGFPYDTDHGAGIGIGDRIYSGSRESHVNYKFNSVTQKQYQASDFTYPSSYIENGNFGIGTTSPSEALHVAGQIKVDDGVNPFTLPASDGSASQVLQTDGSGTVSWATVSGGGGSSPWTTSGSDIYYNTGNVGIGTATPSQPLHVDGNIKTTGSLFYGSSNIRQLSEAANGGLYIGQSTSANFANAGVVIGNNAGRFNSGQGNIGIGGNAGYRGSYSVNQIAIGGSSNSGDSAYNKSSSIGIGENSNYNGSTNTTSVGANTGFNSPSSYTNSAFFGYQAGHSGGNNSVFVGYEAGKSDGVQTVDNTVAVGYQALTALTTGAANTAVGYQAGAALTTGSSNTILGYQAGDALTGSDNTLIGNNAGGGITSNNNNTVIGSGALSTASAPYNNTVIGYNAASSFAGAGIQRNTIIGYLAGTGSNSGTGVTMLGDSATSASSGDDQLVAVGFLAKAGTNGVAVGRSSETGNNSVTIGYDAGNTTGTGNIFIGYQAGDDETGSNKLYIENSNSTTPLIYGEFDNDILRVNGSFEVTGGVTADDGGLTAAGDYGKGAEIWYQGTSTPTAGSVYYLDSSGNWANTDASAESTAKGMIAVSAGTDSDVDGMVIKGFVYLGTDPGGSIGDVVYLSETANQLTTTAPTTASAVVRIVGYKVATNVVYFNPSHDYIVLA